MVKVLQFEISHKTPKMIRPPATVEIFADYAINVTKPCSNLSQEKLNPLIMQPNAFSPV
jgi:hypothetical protein